MDIHISQEAWDERLIDQATWQVAHECVHLFDPGLLGTANCLEEGLATWFQDERRYHDEGLHRYIAIAERTHRPSYRQAKRLVLHANPDYLLPAVKRIRESGTRIGDITADVLVRELPGCEPRTVEALCNRYSDY